MNQKNKAETNTDLTNLKDEEIKNMIINTIQQQLTIVRDMSYYYLIEHISEAIYVFQKEKKLDNIHIEREKEILKKSLSTITESFNKYHLNLSEEEIANEKETLINTRKELYSLVNSLYGYSIELYYMREILDYKTMKDMIKDKGKGYRINREDIDNLINRTKVLLDDEVKDYNRFIKLVSNIILLLPFRMSKLKFYEVLKGTLIRNFSSHSVNIVENKIEEYKMIFNSTLLGDYGILFDQYFTDIQRLKRRRLDGLEPKKKEDIKAIINDIDSRINQVKLFIVDLGIIINRILVLYLTKGKVENLKDDNTYSKFREFEKIQHKGLLKSLLETCYKELEQNEIKLSSKNEYFEKLILESAKRGLAFKEVLNDEIMRIGEALVYYNDMKFSKHEFLFTESYETIHRSHLEQLIDSLIQYINRSITSMSSLERKIRMRRLLSLIELPFNNIDEFLKYIEYSFDERVVSMEEMVFTFFSLNQIIDEFKERH